MTRFYTTQLNAGLGLVSETKRLLELWPPGTSTADLYSMALDSGMFPGMSARRLRNMVAECFAPRYLVEGGSPAKYLKILLGSIGSSELNQLLLLFTCRANLILADFIKEVYWSRYAAGRDTISNDDAMAFVRRAIDQGKTQKVWEDSTIRRVSAYLTGCCADYGLLEAGQKRERRIIPLTIALGTVAYLVYDLHFRGQGDNSVMNHTDWSLFGLTREEAVDEVKRLASKNMLIMQSAGDAVRISWKFESMEEVCHVLVNN